LPTKMDASTSCGWFCCETSRFRHQKSRPAPPEASRGLSESVPTLAAAAAFAGAAAVFGARPRGVTWSWVLNGRSHQ
jgi:hypothetical protein